MLENSLADLLDVIVNPYIPDRLISEQHKKWIRSIAEPLPVGLTDFFGYECRLQDSTPASDFLLCVSQDPGCKILTDAKKWLLPAWLGVPEWKRLSNFAEIWEHHDSYIEKVENMWLEFDIREAPTNMPIPSVFFKPRKSLLSKNADTVWVFDVLERLSGVVVSEKICQQFNHCIHSLPEKSFVFQVATMMSRKNNPLRLCIRDIAPGDLFSYLEKIGWKGDREQIVQQLSWLRYFIDDIAINIDVDEDGVGPIIGLECYTSYGNMLRNIKFLNELVDREFCLPEKCEDILKYHGWICANNHLKDWPIHLAIQSAFLVSDKVSVFWRFLHHVKFVIEANRDIEAKAYLLVCHTWATPEIINQMQAVAEATKFAKIKKN